MHPLSSRFAVIADIHGNTWALDAVLANIDRRGVDEIINLGDIAYGSLDPAGTVDRLTARHAHTIAGNQDRILKEASPEIRETPDFQFVAGQLGDARLRWLAGLPPVMTLGDLFLCHGAPASDETYLLETVTEHGAGLSEPARILSLLSGITQPVILCGHSHMSRTVQLPNGQLVINPGSVGLPAYTDDLPYPHRMESGSPHARYAILTRETAGWLIDHIALPYPWDEAAAAARRQGRPDRARWIETGRA